MLKKAFFFNLLTAITTFPLIAQVSNIKATHDAVNEKYLIQYDLAKSNNQHYFDIEITAMIGGVEVRPSIAALSGDAGLNIKYGSRKKIVWDYYIDLEKMRGAVTFKVRARQIQIPLPPKPKLDLAIGMLAGGSGIYAALRGGITLAKKGKKDTGAIPEMDPITYYYTFCDASSPHHNAALTTPTSSENRAACDAYYMQANEAYQKGISKTTVGLGLLAGGLYTVLAKPFHQAKLKAYQEKHDLTFQPTFDFSSEVGQGLVGIQLKYQFGR